MLRVLALIANPTVGGGIAVAGRTGTSVATARLALYGAAAVGLAGASLILKAAEDGTGRHRA